MKKLNRKGFTLVELLAVIVILAIVVGITMVTVLPTLKNARQEAFELTAQTAADFIEKQYQLYLIGKISTISDEMLEEFNGLTYTDGKSSEVIFTETMITSAGLKSDNYVLGKGKCADVSLPGTDGDTPCTTSKWHINKNTGRACVFLLASSQEYKTLDGSVDENIQEGEYYDVSPTYTYTSECLNGYFK